MGMHAVNQQHGLAPPTYKASASQPETAAIPHVPQGCSHSSITAGCQLPLFIVQQCTSGSLLKGTTLQEKPVLKHSTCEVPCCAAATQDSMVLPTGAAVKLSPEARHVESSYLNAGTCVLAAGKLSPEARHVEPCVLPEQQGLLAASYLYASTCMLAVRKLCAFPVT
jgi:hypothetical protein